MQPCSVVGARKRFAQKFAPLGHLERKERMTTYLFLPSVARACACVAAWARGDRGMLSVLSGELEFESQQAPQSQVN